MQNEHNGSSTKENGPHIIKNTTGGRSMVNRSIRLDLRQGQSEKAASTMRRFLTNTVPRFHTKGDTLINLSSCLVYVFNFLVSLGVISNSARAIGARQFSHFFDMADAPLPSFFIGQLVTELVSSSSTLTSLSVTLVAAGVLPLNMAKYMVWGANIGTSMTNDIVLIFMIRQLTTAEFANKYGIAWVHNVFNILTALLCISIESSTALYSHLANRLTRHMSNDTPLGAKKISLLKQITDPVVKSIFSISSSTLSRAAHDPIFSRCFDTIIRPCLFLRIRNFSGWNDQQTGALALTLSVINMGFSLWRITKIMKQILLKDISQTWAHRTLRACITYCEQKLRFNQLPPTVRDYLIGWRRVVSSLVLTILAQSSSVTTSLATIGVIEGVIPLESFIDFCIGANLGTTFSSLLSALAASSNMKDSLIVALFHIMYNVTGVIVLYLLPPCKRFFLASPINLIQKLAKISKLIPVFCTLVTFVFLPIISLGLGILFKNEPTGFLPENRTNSSLNGTNNSFFANHTNDQALEDNINCTQYLAKLMT